MQHSPGRLDVEGVMHSWASGGTKCDGKATAVAICVRQLKVSNPVFCFFANVLACPCGYQCKIYELVRTKKKTKPIG
jgi:hypothetical protein